MRFPHLAHRSAADHKLHSTRQQHEMKLISGNGETSSRLPAFSLFLPGTCPNNRDRRIQPRPTPPLPAEALSFPSMRQMAPDLLLYPISDVGEALARVPHREVVDPPP